MHLHQCSFKLNEKPEQLLAEFVTASVRLKQSACPLKHPFRLLRGAAANEPSNIDQMCDVWKK